MKVPEQVSESTRKRNPDFYGPGKLNPNVNQMTAIPAEGKRIKQRGRQPTKIELEWHRILSVQYPNYPRPRSQAVTFVLANGVRYTPDEFVSDWPADLGPSMPTCWEIKGPKAWDDAIVKIKVAAHEWPEMRWILVWKEDDQWKQQVVLP